MATGCLGAFLIVALMIHHGNGYQYPFQNPDLDWHDRVDDLVGRLTLEEIVAQTMAIYGTTVPAIPRLGIKPYVWQTECLRGQVHTNTTAFPQAIGLSAAFSHEVVFNISQAVATEVRAQWNNNVKHGVYETFYGLSCFSPVINIVRHPLWGRIQETYGEDPFLTGSLSQHFVWGLQGQHPRYIRANAGCKHFDVYAGPEDIPVSRHKFDAKVGMTDWRMTFLPAFRMCVEAGTYNIMCSYNSVNGIPACVHPFLLTDVLRNEFGFRGYVVSDSHAITDVIDNHKYLHTNEDTVAAAIKAGCNLELGTNVYNSSLNAMKQGKLTEHQIRENVKPLWYTRMRLGEFDPPEMIPYNNITMDEIESEEHRNLAINAAKMSTVLLKNDKNLLPLQKKYKKVAIVGPMANNAQALFGNYASNLNPKYTKSPWDTLKQLGDDPHLADGCSDPNCKTANLDDVRKNVQGSELAVVCLGTGEPVESEGNDRSNINLPGQQADILQAATEAANGAPVILLLFNAGPLDITWAKQNSTVTAIMEAFLPAQAAGDAIYQILTMQDGSVPAGRLPVTWPASMAQVLPITNYTMKGRTYRYFEGDPLYPFGYGLSYTTFQYSDLKLSSSSIQTGQQIDVQVTVQNTGPVSADEVVQVYLQWNNASLPAPKLQLVGFKRVFVAKGAKVTVDFTVRGQQMELWFDNIPGFNVVPGDMTIYAGGQQPNQKTAISSNVLSAKFTITA